MSRLKGPARPVLALEERLEILASLQVVDYVVPFSEATPAEIIAEVKPHVLVKGDDYGADEVVGRDFVEAAGGRLELIPVVSGQSSSLLVETILERYGSGPGDGQVHGNVPEAVACDQVTGRQ